MKFIASAAVLVSVGVLVGGCSGNDAEMKQQIADAKTKPAPTSAQLQQGFARIAANHEKSNQESANWAKAHPQDAARINAERAAVGKPPLGQ